MNLTAAILRRDMHCAPRRRYFYLKRIGLVGLADRGRS